jgi:hypothetical protein
MKAATRRSMGLVLTGAILLMAGCGLIGAKSDTPPPAQAIIPAPAFLPPDRAVDKWDRCDKVHNYNPDNLYLTLGRDAQHYKDYVVQGLVQTKYRVGLEGTERLDVQVYRMSDNVNAFGVYSVQRNKEAQPAEIGARGCASELTADAVKGQYYVRLVLDKAVPESRDSLVRFAAYIAGKLPGDNALPALLKAFPEKDRVANSEEYLAPGFLGRSYLKGGYRVLYETDGKKYSMFLTNAGSPDDAIMTMTMFRMSFANTGAAEPLLVGPWLRAFWGLDSELGRAFVFQKGPYIAGTMGLPDLKLADQLARELANALP